MAEASFRYTIEGKVKAKNLDSARKKIDKIQAAIDRKSDQVVNHIHLIGEEPNGSAD